MKERPIFFTGPMVRAILEGRKTQTRRTLRSQPLHDPNEDRYRLESILRHCPYGVPGDRLWVRETWAVGACADGLKPRELDPPTWKRDNGGLWYPADGTVPAHPISPRGRTRVGRFMPRWASRLTLEITDVRVQRLQEISVADIYAEGVVHPLYRPGSVGGDFGVRQVIFPELWDSINAKRAPWASNPWVWVITFKRVA